MTHGLGGMAAEGSRSPIKPEHTLTPPSQKSGVLKKKGENSLSNCTDWTRKVPEKTPQASHDVVTTAKGIFAKKKKEMLEH